MRGNRSRELGGWLGALLLATATAAQVASTERAELLFRDGDSLVVALLVRSITEGQPFDWAMSSVLFIPETLAFGMLWMLSRPFDLGVDIVLAAAGALNLVGLYGGIRLAAGRRRDGAAPVAWSLVALAAFCLIAATETSSSRDALELASLQLTTTYYAATVVAVAVSVGIVRRAFDRSGSGRSQPAWLAAVASASVLSNPLFVAWATVPLAAILGVAAVYPTSRRKAVLLLAWLLGGTVVGLLARIPLSPWIANSGTGYAQPGQWPESARYYGDLLAQRLSNPLGVTAAFLVAALLVLAIRQALRAQDAGARVVAASAFVLPLLVTIGAIALGTHAARYLEPALFAPVLALVASPRIMRVSRRAATVLTATVTGVLVVGAGLSVPRIVAAAQHPDPDLTCVTDWVTESGRTGGGQFWTVRLPKLHLDDPSQLVQVDHRLSAYAWLVNRSDFAAGAVTFLIEDAHSTPWQLGSNAVPTETVSCGRYTIHDFAPATLPLGPQHF